MCSEPEVGEFEVKDYESPLVNLNHFKESVG